MNYGRFFALDKVSSQFENGIVLFNYTALENIEDYPKKIRGEAPIYPIYLTLSKDSIEFIYHYCENHPANGSCKHFHNAILSLPLSSNLEIKDGLTSALAEAYETNFPVEERDCFLYKRIYDDNPSIVNDEISYSNLTIISVFIGGKVQKKSFIRKLILDFLFDFEHTDVFQNSPFYEYISIKLKENYFFNSLANKAMFYYYKTLFSKIDKESSQLFNYFYAERLFSVEKEWTRSIRDIRSDQTFHDSKRWFDSPEDEMKGIYNSNEKDKTKSIRKKLYDIAIKEGLPDNTFLKHAMKSDSKLSSQWNIKRCAFSNLFTAGQTIALTFIMLLPLLSLLIHFLYNIFCGKLLPHFGVSLQLIAYSFILFIVFGCVRIFSDRKYFFGSHVYFPRLLIAILTGWVTIFFGTTLFSSSSIDQVTKNSSTIILAILTMLLALFWFTYIEMGRLSPYIEKSRRFWRALYFLLISFFYSHMAGFFLSFLTKIRELEFDIHAISNELYYFRNSIEPEWSLDNNKIQVFYLFTFLAMFIGLFLNMMLQEKRATEAL